MGLPASAHGATFGDPQPSAWVTNGDVNDIEPSGKRTFVGGKFDYVGPRTGHAAVISAGTGNARQPFPDLDGIVHDIVSDGAGGWYVAREFEHLHGVVRDGVTHIDENGEVTQLPAELGAVRAPVFALALSPDGETLYVGGAHAQAFDTGDGSELFDTAGPDSNGSVNALSLSPDGGALYVAFDWNDLLELDAETGVPRPGWDPAPNLPVFDLLATDDSVYVAGDFEPRGQGPSIGGANRLHLAELNRTDGAATQWDPAGTGTMGYSTFNFRALVLAPDGSTLYAGGVMPSLDGKAISGLVTALDTETGVADWTVPTTGGPVRALAMRADSQAVFVGGQFQDSGSIQGKTRNHLAALSTAGKLLDWNPNAGDAAMALEVAGNQVAAGGWFSSVNGVNRRHLVAFNRAGVLIRRWKAAVPPISALGSTRRDSRLYVSGGHSGAISIRALRKRNGSRTRWAVTGQGPASELFVSRDGRRIFAGGHFTELGGRPAAHLAALSRRRERVVWNGRVSAVVSALALSPNEKTLYLAGGFGTPVYDEPGHVGTAVRKGLAAVKSADGSVRRWNPGSTSGYSGYVEALAVGASGDPIYVAGQFNGVVGGQARNNLAAISSSSGLATSWNPHANGAVSSIALSPGSLFAVGRFRPFLVPPPPSQSIGGAPRTGVAELSRDTGLATDWAPDPGEDPFISSSPTIVKLSPNGRRLFIGGNFESMAGRSHEGFAQFRAPGVG